MSAPDHKQIAESWLAVQRQWWAFEALSTIVSSRPQEGMSLILQVLELANSSNDLTDIGCGPLEALLRDHAATVIDDIETRAKDNEALSTALSHVWYTGEGELAQRLADLGCRILPPKDVAKAQQSLKGLFLVTHVEDTFQLGRLGGELFSGVYLSPAYMDRLREVFYAASRRLEADGARPLPDALKNIVGIVQRLTKVHSTQLNLEGYPWTDADRAALADAERLVKEAWDVLSRFPAGDDSDD